MSNCPSCGGVLGVDCFNPQECMEITQHQAAMYRHGMEQKPMLNIREEFHHFVSYVLSARKSNTDRWMESLAKKINSACQSLGEKEQFEYDGDGFVKKMSAGS
ncbi:MAG: hypothetical protein U0872_15360 [Planctomycetaceae bacterium]